MIVDNRELKWQPTEEQVAAICQRRFGVGADGLMTLETTALEGFTFEMKYYNSDGHLGSMCGNGGRCIATFDYLLERDCAAATPVSLSTIKFLGYDGPHEADILEWDGHTGLVRLGMRSVPTDSVRRVLDGWYLDTGSPHYVQHVSNLEHYDVFGEGRRLRHRTDLFPGGANIDFVEELSDGRLFVRTYERGVEDETWACGTGVTACAIVTGNRRLVTRGGDFTVDFSPTPTAYDHVRLTGPVSLNFTGLWPID
ncbi:MAG: diaminopimelate epimerase [Bacteroidales bacterium]|nr:diaminopimelate epimerase [Bacteroidales bacterium]